MGRDGYIREIADYNSAWLFVYDISSYCIESCVRPFFLFRVQCWSQFIVPVHRREWSRGSILAPSYKAVIVYTFHLSNCNTSCR